MTTRVAAARDGLLAQPSLLRARLRAAPPGPGVYLMRDRAARVIYVGKSGQLRQRLRSYFATTTHPPRIRRLVDTVADFEVIACATEREALILENTLVKRYRPDFNVRLKDDKSYLYLRVPRPARAAATGAAPEMADRLRQFPRPTYVRRPVDDGHRYFGPFTDASGLRRAVRDLRTAFPFRGCPDSLFKQGRVCLDFHIGQCLGPCEDRVSPADYAALLDEVAAFMDGRVAEIATHLEAGMAAASDALDFERAAWLRDRLQAVRRVGERQAVSHGGAGEVDIIGYAAAAGRGCAVVLAVRAGRLQGMETHALQTPADVDPAEALSSFLGQYYGAATHLPRTVVVPVPLPDAALLSEALASRRHGRVAVHTARRGRLRALTEQAQASAATALGQAQVEADFDRARTAAILRDLQERLGLPAPPERIECYDISNTMGTDSVGSMVVFEHGRPKPADYRIFGIRTVAGANDFASLQEVLSRRFARLEADVAADGSFSRRPDLVIVDGGRGQVGAAAAVLAAQGLATLPLFGLAKREEELFAPGQVVPIRLPLGSQTLFLMQRLRDEAHRFAITRHRARRTRSARGSRLDQVTGVGPKRRGALLRRFGSLDRLREATLEDLMSVPGITRPVALAIRELV